MSFYLYVVSSVSTRLRGNETKLNTIEAGGCKSLRRPATRGKRQKAFTFIYGWVWEMACGYDKYHLKNLLYECRHHKLLFSNRFALAEAYSRSGEIRRPVTMLYLWGSIGTNGTITSWIKNHIKTTKHPLLSLNVQFRSNLIEKKRKEKKLKNSRKLPTGPFYKNINMYNAIRTVIIRASSITDHNSNESLFKRP
jgi:hypothetical protein